MPDGPRTVRLTPEEIAAEFLPVLREGLPVRPETAGEYLPYFPLVLAHAKTTDHLSRVIGLDVVVTHILSEWPDNSEGAALRILFGLNPAHRGRTLSQRQLEAARVMKRSTEHMRKHLQAKLLSSFTYEFLRRNERYKVSPTQRVFMNDKPGTPGGDDDLMLLEYQARCISALYAVRADLLAIRRIGEHAPTMLQSFARSSLRHFVELQRFVREAVEKYGVGLRPDNPDSGIPVIEGVLNGTGPFTEAELVQLVLQRLTSPEEDPPLQLLAKWTEWASAALDRRHA